MTMHLIQAIKEEYARNREKRKRNNQWVMTAWKEIQIALHHFHGANGIKVSSVEGGVNDKAQIEVSVFDQYRMKVYLLPDKTGIAFGYHNWRTDVCYSNPEDIQRIIGQTIALMGLVLEEADYDMLITASGLSLQQQAKAEIERIKHDQSDASGGTARPNA
jgi:hypothetical protein